MKSQNIIKSIGSFILLIVLSINILNIHEYTHIFEDDTAEHCETCVIKNTVNHTFLTHTSNFDLETAIIFVKRKTTNTTSFVFSKIVDGKYFNKPPPIFI